MSIPILSDGLGRTDEAIHEWLGLAEAIHGVGRSVTIQSEGCVCRAGDSEKQHIRSGSV
jgi:hypothetical protein